MTQAPPEVVSFSPSDDQQQLIDTIRRYAVNNLQPAAHDMDEHGRLDTRLTQTGWEIGLVPTAIPEAIGGLGEMSAVTGVLAMEELAYGDLAAAFAIGSPALLAYPVTLYGTDEQQASLLPMFLEETPAPASAALLEPGMFFDPHHLKTTAARDNESVRLNGAKAYVTDADRADQLLVYARDMETGRIDGYLVARDTPGMTIGAREKLMGVRALPQFTVTFSDAALPLSCRLGGETGIGYDALLSRMRVALAAAAVGVARAAFEYARDYAKQRVAFGVPIAQKQAIAFLLAEMAIEVDSARLMAWEAAWQIDQGQDATRASALARQFADRAAVFVADGAVQTLGGYGFIREYPVERYLRNARGFTTFDGLAIV